ncbi:hypothetical protein DM860_009658 [Cuscuta australis]|uniref:F-box associated domain-containing protein n=1 Tax=Cuscuta australis TaxID=267555 RepID=A0A328DJV1_9ASTE|nr:hypothetical protein DM860_009658 [Cuscuta australis]
MEEGGGDKKAEVVLVRTLGADEPKHYDEDGVYCRRVRFHQVDLSEGKIKSNCFPSMLNRIGDGAMELSQLPPELVGCRVSDGGVISDPPNSRLLVHLYEGTLYAFYPGSGEWELIGSLLHWRYPNVVLVDNVLYIHDFKSWVFLYAYDVARRQQLKVTWSSKKYEYNNGYRVKVTKYEFDAMFYVGGVHFPMATWSPCDGDEGTTSSASTMFFKFKVDRPNNGLHIVCTPVDIQCHDIQNTIKVTGFLLL